MKKTECLNLNANFLQPKNGSKNGPKMVQKWSKNGPKMVQKWSKKQNCSIAHKLQGKLK